MRRERGYLGETLGDVVWGMFKSSRYPWDHGRSDPTEKSDPGETLVWRLAQGLRERGQA